MRTSRSAWGASIADSPDASAEWELGSRVFNELEMENNSFTRLGALTTRIGRANKVVPQAIVSSAISADDFFENLVSVKGKPDVLYFVYDVAADGVCIATQVDPPLVGEFILNAEDIEESTEWEYVQAGGRDNGFH